MVWESNVAQNRLREGPAPGKSTTGPPTTTRSRRSPRGGRPRRRCVAATAVRRSRACRSREASSRSSAARRSWAGPSRATNTSAGLDHVRQDRRREPVLVLSHRLWQSLGADPALVGGTVYVEGRNWRVIGVMPADFAVPDLDAAFWTPWDMRESYRGPRFPDGPPRDARFLRVVGRVKPGLSREAATDAMEILAARLAADHPRTNAGWSVQLVPLQRRVGALEPHRAAARVRRGVLFAAAGLRQRRQSRDCARRRARAGDGDPPGARRRPRHASSGSIWRKPRCARC